MLANLVNIFDQTIREAEITLANGRIQNIRIIGAENPANAYILPGFVDAHVHVESSMLTPAQFARLAVVHGTISTVSDPHEIANVLGVQGVEFMIDDAARVPFKFCFGAPSCVPATIFETAGASLGPDEVAFLLRKNEIGYLAEVMNFPGVLSEDPDMMAKIALAKQYNKVIDGHAPGLRGEPAEKYISYGITTDHECFTYEEAREKIGYGCKILIREGSAARNFDALIPLIDEFPGQIMFCSDDKHPDSLVAGHIDQLVRRAVADGYNIWNILLAACINPVLHYKLSVGLLRKDDPADFIVVDNLQNFRVLETWIDGQMIAQAGKSFITNLRSTHINKFKCSPKSAGDFGHPFSSGEKKVRVIEALEGQLITNEMIVELASGKSQVIDMERDILKIVVVNRYADTKPAIGYIKNFGLKEGAIASSVAHDSHNVICVGCDDERIAEAVNLVIGARGGISAAGAAEQLLLPLPIAGLLSDEDGYAVAEAYTRIDQYVKNTLGSTLASPFMTLSFMALLVIPSLKLSDKGLFDGKNFRFVPLSI